MAVELIRATAIDAMTTSNDASKLLAERACEQLGYAFFRCFDFFDQDALPELFARGGELVDDRVYAGTEALATALSGQERRPARHLVGNVFIELQGPDSARGITYVSQVSGAGETLRVGHTEDTFVRWQGEWRFARRRLHWLPSG